jgi:hypothetical protein
LPCTKITRVAFTERSVRNEKTALRVETVAYEEATEAETEMHHPSQPDIRCIIIFLEASHIAAVVG